MPVPVSVSLCLAVSRVAVNVKYSSICQRCVCVCVCVCTYVCMYACVFVFVCVWMQNGGVHVRGV